MLVATSNYKIVVQWYNFVGNVTFFNFFYIFVMAKKRVTKRGRNRQKLIEKYRLIRVNQKMGLRKRMSLRKRLKVNSERQKVPRNRSPTRLRNRCRVSGCSRGYFRHFGLSRHFLRKLAHQGILPRMHKSSW